MKKYFKDNDKVVLYSPVCQEPRFYYPPDKKDP